MPIIPATWEAEIGRIVVPGQPGKKRDPISNITRAKRTGGVVQAVHHLPSKREAMSSNPSMEKKYIKVKKVGPEFLVLSTN
jgi:hypothetical protein